jgi:hypothetical protein
MRIRRPVAGLFVALALFGGGVTLTACDPTEATTGTPLDDAKNTDGSHPEDPTQGAVPDNGNREPSSSDTRGPDVGNG